MSDVDKGPDASNASTFSPSTSSGSRDAEGTTRTPQSDGAGRTEATADASPPKASSSSSADFKGEGASLKVGANLASIRDKLADARNIVQDRYRAVSESTDDFAHDSPWKAIALAALAGVIVGMLAAR